MVGESLTPSVAGNFDNSDVGIGKTVTVKVTLADGAGGSAGNYRISDATTRANINPVANLVQQIPPSIPTAPVPPTLVPSIPPPIGFNIAGAPGGGSGTTGGASGSPSASPGAAAAGAPMQLALSSTGQVAAPGAEGNRGAESTSSSSATARAGSAGFVNVRTFGSLDVPAGAQFSFALPVDTFKHTDPKASVAMEARTPEGRALPSWLNFEPGTGRFTGKAPEGVSQMSVVVTARDNLGNDVSTNVVLNFAGQGAAGAAR